MGVRAGGRGHQNTTRVKDYICTMPMKLESGWNQVQLNLADLTKYAGLPAWVPRNAQRTRY